MTFPGGSFAKDPNSLGAYDRAAGKWLPVFRAWTSPDGLHYAYPEYRPVTGPATGIIHIVDVSTGADKGVNVPAPSLVVSYETAGVYVTRVVPNSGAAAMALTLVDPVAGTFKQITADERAWLQVGGPSAYAADLDGSDPKPPSGPGAANRVLKLDLASGAITTYFSSPGNSVQILGLDASNNPVIGITSATSYSVRLGTSAIFSGPPADTNPGGPLVVDSHGVWFGSQSGRIWLFPAGGPLQKMADSSTPGGFPAAGCA